MHAVYFSDKYCELRYKDARRQTINLSICEVSQYTTVKSIRRTQTKIAEKSALSKNSSTMYGFSRVSGALSSSLKIYQSLKTLFSTGQLFEQASIIDTTMVHCAFRMTNDTVVFRHKKP